MEIDGIFFKVNINFFFNVKYLGKNEVCIKVNRNVKIYDVNRLTLFNVKLNVKKVTIKYFEYINRNFNWKQLMLRSLTFSKR